MKHNVSPDAELLQHAHAFDRQALTEIYDRYSPALYRYALRRLGDPAQAEDCVAETFSRFLQALRRGHGPRDFLQAYLYRIAHNWITDRFRQPLAPEELDEEQADPAAGPEERAARRIRQAGLRAALHQLTSDQQQVIALKYLEGRENEQIARALGKPVGAVKSLQHRALAHLERLLPKEEMS